MSGQLNGRALAVLLAIIGLMWWIAPGRTDQAPPQKKAKATKPAKEAHAANSHATKGAKSENDTVRLIHKLNQPIDLDGFDANTPFKEALGLLSEKYDLTILVDSEAFKADLNNADVESAPIRLAKIKKLRLETVLTMLAGQVGGTFLVRSNYVEITSRIRATYEVWGMMSIEREAPADISYRRRPQLPIVHAAFDNRPLTEVLRDLSDASGISVVVDLGRAGANSQTSVTATLKNVPLDTAVRLLANQAELRTVLVDNVIYVTDQENADALQAEVERINSSGQAASPQSQPAAAAGM
jgi:hypothetical protein